MAPLRNLSAVRAQGAGGSPAGLGGKGRPSRPRGGLVERALLVRRLREAREVPLALLVAPAGYGKSTVLEQWAGQDERRFAWLDVDVEDDEPGRLLVAVRSALESAGVTQPGQRSGGTPAALLGSIERSTESFVLVVDGGQALRRPEPWALLAAIVEHLPRGSQLALASRCEPAMPVGRLRAHRKVMELRHRDLALAPSEAQALLHGAGVAAGNGEVEALLGRTGGWPAGLYLSALSAEDAGATLVADYVRDEILTGLPSRQLAFLMRSSVLDRLSGPVCDHLLEGTGSARLLAELARANVPLFPVQGPDVYLLNPLVAETMRAELRRSDPALERKLHRRAASWYAGRGDADSAARHAIHARDAALTGEVLWSNVLRYTAHGRNSPILGWLEAFTDGEIEAQPALALVAACGWLAFGDRDRAAHWIEVAARALPRAGSRGLMPSLEGGVAIMRAAACAGDIRRMGEQAARAYELLPDGNPWLATCCLLRGVASRLTGAVDVAREQLEEGARRGAVSAPGAQALCLAQLALLALDEKDPAEAELLAARARAQVERCGLSTSPESALVYAVSAMVRADRGRVDEATIDLRRATGLSERLDDPPLWYAIELHTALAHTALRLGDIDAARDLVARAARLLPRVPAGSGIECRLDAARARIDALQGQAGGAQWSLTTAELRLLQFLPTHLSYPDIAVRLNVSANTVKTHVRAVYRKLNSSSRAEAVACARSAGLVGTDGSPRGLAAAA